MTIAALMTNEKKPNVKHVIGKEQKLMIGFRNVFKIDKTKATFIASIGPETIGFGNLDHKAGKIYESAITVATFIRNRMMSFITENLIK